MGVLPGLGKWFVVGYQHPHSNHISVCHPLLISSHFRQLSQCGQLHAAASRQPAAPQRHVQAVNAGLAGYGPDLRRHRIPEAFKPLSGHSFTSFSSMSRRPRAAGVALICPMMMFACKVAAAAICMDSVTSESVRTVLRTSFLRTIIHGTMLRHDDGH